MYRNGVPPPWEGPEKRKIEKTKKTYTLNAIKRLENTDEEKYRSRAMHCRSERKVERM